MSNAKQHTETSDDMRSRLELMRDNEFGDWDLSRHDTNALRWVLATLDAKQREVERLRVGRTKAQEAAEDAENRASAGWRKYDEARRDLAAAEEVIGSAQDYLQHGRPERAKRDLDAYEWPGKTNHEEPSGPGLAAALVLLREARGDMHEARCFAMSEASSEGDDLWDRLLIFDKIVARGMRRIDALLARHENDEEDDR